MVVLPEPIQRHLDRCLLSPPDGGQDVLIDQRGEMRLEEDGRWLPFTAEQWFAADRVAFCWHARVKMAPLVTAVVEDAFEDGRGRLQAKLWGMVRIADAKGPEVDRGEAARYLAELAWNPLALRDNPELRFGQGQDGPVRIWAIDPETYVDVRFDTQGDICGIFTRTRQRDGEAQPWEGEFSDYRELGGVRVPTRAEVRWHLPSGPFAYWRGEVTGVHWRSVASTRQT